MSIRLTQAQRKVVAELVPQLDDRLLLDKPATRTLSLTLEEIQLINQKAQESIPHAETGVIRNSLRHIIDATNKAIDNSQGIDAIPKSERLYQFKITLNEFKPPIWRRIQVRNCTLDRLHELIQTAMGWTNSHLHQFEIDGDRYGDPELLECGEPDDDYIDSTVTKISEIVPKDGKRFLFDYEYDFGDCWQHEVLFEGCLRAARFISKVNGRARLKMSVASGATLSSSKPLPILTTRSMIVCWSGRGRLIPKTSILQRRRRRCGEGCRIGGSFDEQEDAEDRQ